MIARLRHPAAGVLAVLLGLGTCACTGADTREPYIASVDPNRVAQGTTPAISVLGDNFFGLVAVNLNSTRDIHVDTTFKVYLGASHLPGLDVRRLSSQTLLFTLPLGLPLGKSDLVVVTPQGKQARLADAFDLVAAGPVASDGSGGASASGGSGGNGASGGSGGNSATGGNPSSAGGSGGNSGALGGSPNGLAPLASTWGDDFEDGVIGAEWETIESPGCVVLETNGGTRFALDGRKSRCDMVSRAEFDLRGGQAFFEISPITDYSPPFRAFIQMVFSNGETLEVGFADDTFTVRLPASRQAATPAPAPYQPAPDYWRFHEVNGVLTFESSPDGQSWRKDFDLGSGWALERVRLGMGVEATADMPGSINLNISGYNRF